MIAPNVILPFDGLNSAIPAGYTRDDRFNGKYIKVTNSNWGSTGGTTTHTHSVGSHSHSWTTNSHSHSSGIIQGSTIVLTNAKHQDNPSYDIVPFDHTHNPVSSGAMVISSNPSATPSIGSANNDYSRYSLIFIKSNGYNLLPTNSIIFINNTNSRPNSIHFDSLNDKYLFGALSGENAGATATVTTHSHTQSHSHTFVHSHGNSSATSVNSGAMGTNNGSGEYMAKEHTHVIYFADKSYTASDSTAVPSQTATLSFRELHAWKISTPTMPRIGDIAFYTESTLPLGWSDLGYDGIYIKGKASGQGLTTGGSLTHTHSGLNHSHSTSGSHTHSWSSSQASGTRGYTCCADAKLGSTHSHSGTSDANTSPDTNSAIINFGETNHEPPYINVRLIQFEFSIGGGAIVTKMLN
jgi:hypothetical protein